MSSEVAIRAEQLGKQYRLGERDPHKTLREVVRHGLVGPARYLAGRRRSRGEDAASPRSTQETLWALKEVSFDVRPGEALGIIGRNGAGKSTLLKILARITRPTTGRAEIHGRVGSLLEVGTGFHPELTGRENVFLNGAILGMTRSEIENKFDEIVAFSGVEKFLDTPIKRYSSGMRVRLAFAVAGHLEPEILIVDEVLAVGDAEFQRKCLGKMEQVAEGGRTILFVSHNMEAISTLCDRCLLLDAGSMLLDGKPGEVVARYLEAGLASVVRGERALEACEGLPFRVTTMRTVDAEGEPGYVFSRSRPVAVEMEIDVETPSDDLLIALDVHNAEERLLFRTHSFDHEGDGRLLARKGHVAVRCELPAGLLPPGRYRLGLITAIAGRKRMQDVPNALEFEILQDELYGGRFTSVPGLLTPACVWQRA